MRFALRREDRQEDEPVQVRLSDTWMVLSLPFLAFLGLPLLALLFGASPSALGSALGAPVVIQAVLLSMGTSLTTMVLTIVAGTPVAYLLARRHPRGRSLLDSLVAIPTVLPPAVAGLALLMAFGRRGLLGDVLETLNIHVAFTTSAVVLAQLFVAGPIYVAAAAIGFSGISEELEHAAQLDGATHGRVFWYISVPLAWPALVTGAALTWARALGEFGATLIFAGNFPGRTQTMPLAIYMGLEGEIDLALALSLILVVCAFGVLVIVRWLSGAAAPLARRQ